MNGASSLKMDESRTIGGYGSASHDEDVSIAKSIGEDSTDVTIRNWRGVATKDEKSCSVRLDLETIRTVDPDEARRLLASNISLEEVRYQARTGYRDTILKGSIKLNNDSYRLTDIALTSSDNKSTLEASIARPSSGSGSKDAASIIGYAVLTISYANGVDIAKGYMVINDSKYNGTYCLLLNEGASRGPRAG